MVRQRCTNCVRQVPATRACLSTAAAVRLRLLRRGVHHIASSLTVLRRRASFPILPGLDCCISQAIRVPPLSRGVVAHLNNLPGGKEAEARIDDWRERRYSAFLNMYPVICSWNMRLASASPVAMAVVSKACLGRDPNSPSTVVRTASCTYCYDCVCIAFTPIMS